MALRNIWMSIRSTEQMIAKGNNNKVVNFTTWLHRFTKRPICATDTSKIQSIQTEYKSNKNQTGNKHAAKFFLRKQKNMK
jgi:hypothetical protein